MAQVIKNMGQFAKALEPKVVATLELVAEDVKKEIDEALQRYYDEYDPSVRASITSFYYHRTDQLIAVKLVSQKSVAIRLVLKYIWILIHYLIILLVQTHIKLL